MSGTVNCANCGSAWSKPDGANFGVIKITRCPNCGQTEESTASTPLPWAIPPQTEEVKVSARAALDELLAEVAADEKDWEFNDKLDMAVRVEEERKKREGKK